MQLIKNTVVFLDTGFFKEYKPRESSYIKLFDYAKSENISLCTSHICTEEWRTQKLKNTKDFIDETRGKLGSILGGNPLARKILIDCFRGDFLDGDWLLMQSKDFVKEFIVDNKIKIFSLSEQHMQAAWDSYFHGKEPFESIKSRKDIP